MPNGLLRRKVSRENDQHVLHERRVKIARLYLEGKNQYQIANMLIPQLTQARVSQELKAIRGEWLASTIKDFDAAKAKELAKVDRLEEVAWERFWLSCQDGVIRTKKTEKVLRKKMPQPPKMNGKGKAFPKVEEIEEIEEELKTVKVNMNLVKRGQVGDPRWLDQVKWCVEFRCNLFGFIKPPEVKQTNNFFNLGELLDSIPLDVPDKAEERIARSDIAQLPVKVEDAV